MKTINEATNLTHYDVKGGWCVVFGALKREPKE
jgi:hypothetical protein